jgi:hypothetical protein
MIDDKVLTGSTENTEEQIQFYILPYYTLIIC